MASEAITRNDLKAILNEVLPPTPSEYRKLLWENPSPTAAFAAQTISLDLSDYDVVQIDAYLTANGMISTRFTAVGFQGEAGGLGSSGDRYTRNANVTTTGVAFTVGRSNGTESASACIPYKIYGIKYERVAPPQVELPTYSTTEQVIGTWIDGKPIYRKVLTGTSTAGTTNINISSLNIAFPISANVIIHNTNGNWVFGSYIQTSGSDSLNVYMHENFSTVYLRSGSSYAFGQYWLTLEYTKTTD